MERRHQFRLLFERQWLHVLLLAFLVIGARLVCNFDGVLDGQLWGITTLVWFWLAITLAMAHQLFVWFCWRIQLHCNWLSRFLGNLAFPLYAAVFSMLGILRVVAVFLLAISNSGTQPGNSIILKLLAVVMMLPAAYLFYSVFRYFSFKRAFGIDHFDASYRALPLVRSGIFRFTRNGMYVFGFLLLWVPGLWFTSAAALCIALFNHLYIWVHYYSTELPDMQRMYGEVGATKHNESAQ